MSGRFMPIYSFTSQKPASLMETIISVMGLLLALALAVVI